MFRGKTVIRWIRQAGITAGAGVSVGFLLAALAGPVAASEPDGHVELRAEWVKPAPGQGPSVIRLRIRSLIVLEDSRLTVSTPIDVELRPAMSPGDVGFETVPARQHRQAIRNQMQRVDRESTATFDFEVALSPGRRGVVEFIVEGRDPAGRTIRNAIGFVVSESVSVGAQRLGAIEFPAAVVSGTEEK